MFFNRIMSLAFCLVISIAAVCQAKEVKLKFGDITPEDFKPNYAALDSSADAVYLDDIGSSHHDGNNSGSFSVVYTIHERILLLHKKSFDDLATVKIYLGVSGDEKEKLVSMQAATYNMEDGKIVQTKVDKSSIFQDKDGDYQVIKFTFPDLKEGSIIEYTYTTNSPEFWHIPTWTFQGRYPELWSQFTIEVPQFFDFTLLKQGYLDPVIDTAMQSANTFNVLEPNDVGSSRVISIRSATIRHTWAFKNIPALKDEHYITALSNYVQRLEFQLQAIRFPDTEPKTYLSTWYETVDQLMKNEDFGADLNKENGWLKDDIKEAEKNETGDLNKAKNIYAFVRDNYSCTDKTAVYLSQTLKKTAQTKKGNVADINLLLVAMLKVAGYNANPVLLSTRDHGKTYDAYPIMNKFNYVIAEVDVNNKSYLLDASDNLLGFGHLSEDCYNGDARMIAPQPIIVNLSPDSLHESEITSLFLSNDADGKISGTYKNVMGEMQSEAMREKMKKTDEAEYFKNLKKSFSFDVTLDNKIIDSLDNPEMPVAVQYDISFKPEDDIIYFTPVLSDGAYKENPFSAAKRFYPVEMPYCVDETYILNMEVPTGYKVDELPKSARVSLNDGEGMFEYLIQQSGDNIQLRCRTKINQATFEPDDYETLRNFFAFVVEKEGEQIVFKKQ
ncbi:MAG: transglutaminase domain-containing protein [Parafilimonas sp.]